MKSELEVRSSKLGLARIAFLALTTISYLLASIALADPIPSDRRTTWQGNVGVPGGIPNRAITTSLNPSGGSDTAAILSAINALPNGGCLKLNAGTWNVNVGAVRKAGKNNFTVRGAGTGQTILNAGGGGAFYFGTADYPYPTSGQTITAGATAGSSTFTMANTSSFTIGNLCHISQTDPTWVTGNDGPRDMTITMKVVTKTSTTVTVDHALPIDFTNSPQLVPYPTAPMTGVGIEDLTIDGQNVAGQGIAWEQAYGCWIKNVELKRSNARQFFLIVFNQGEIRHCFVRDVHGGGPNHEGIDFYNRGCWNLVENNICDNGGFAPINFGDSHGGCVGNVVGYNYVQNISTASDTMGAGIALNHGAHNMFNLVEGNIVNTGISSDGYYGSSSHNTVFRNWARGRSETVGGVTTVQGFRTIQLNRMSDYWNVAGNVLGDSSFPSGSTGAYDTNGAVKYNIYSLGYPNLGNFGFSGNFGPQTPPNYTLAPDRSLPNGYQGLDLNVRNTLLRHGNYDYFNHSIVWDPAIADHIFLDSYYLSTKPGFLGNLTWPPIDPTNPGTVTVASIPAGYRFLNGSDPAGSTDTGGGGGPTPTPGNQSPTVSITAPAADAIVTDPGSFTITATANDPDGTIAKVEFFQGTTKLGEDTAAPYSFNWTGVTAGDYVLTAKATDNAGATGSSGTITVRVAAVLGLSFNADAGVILSPFSITAGTPALVSQTVVTTDPTQGGQARYYFSITTPGDYQIGARVNCVDGGSNSFFVQVDAQPTISNIWDVLLTSGLQTRVVSWGGNAQPPQTFTLTAGVHYLVIRGREAGALLGPITISGQNQPPTVSITGPADGTFYLAEPATVPITATAADSDGTVAKVEFFANVTKIGEDLASPFTFNWTAVPAGNYTITGKATDNAGLTTTSAGIAIQVLPRASLPKTIVIPR